MAEKITVYVNNIPVGIFRGMSVKHALVAFDQRLYEAATEGVLSVEDEHGFQVGLVKTWEERARPVRNKQRVEQLLPSVQRLLTGPELYLHNILPHLHIPLWQHNMLVHILKLPLPSIHFCQYLLILRNGVRRFEI